MSGGKTQSLPVWIWHRHDYWFFKHFCHFCTWKDEINWSLIKRFIHCYYNLQFKRKNILEPLNSHFGSGRFRMTLTFLLIFFNSCAIEQVCFTTFVVLYTQQVYVSQPLWYCIALCRLMLHNPFGYVSQPLWYCVKS